MCVHQTESRKRSKALFHIKYRAEKQHKNSVHRENWLSSARLHCPERDMKNGSGGNGLFYLTNHYKIV